MELTYKEIRYCQIQKVVVALSPQTLVYFESEDNQRVSQDNHNNQSHHQHHQNDKHRSRKREVGVDFGRVVAKIIST